MEKPSRGRTVIDITAELEQREFGRKFARLAKLAEDYEIDLLSKPRRHLDLAYNELYRLSKALEATYEALTPSISFVTPSQWRPFDHVADAIRRNGEAQRIVSAALWPENVERK